ncbi:MFS transporter [Stutzerimonas kunmingensis]|jgi:MFS family permease|uniref:Major facilitator family transporter n=1 Tax=Stutzerimonas stutzeri CCUG 29243 TaxID=1196835 RepID=I4CUC9_STUST|nr:MULTISPECIES: MFS transporter [Stutzerimonas stutzeri subgroup]KKJ93654.1 MFS transporter [Stutzerimonas stutzeri]MAF86609.1 MFS transporter [Pseudomonas sp.]MBU0565751.1 MFS transporter [Gammaproteobacteria bacterium]AFM33686.1 major facilitator family transporter [Stutzerimonas stutzeri CCUG 29243]MAK88539.1 MFS transporter [Pseudomonas sp.]|tara:strand:- start:1795 stop:3111 length:1317 start_codon:yes stop_codon:yes gene_type:complete
MKTLIAPISSLLAGVALLLLGHGLLNTLLTLRGVAEGYSTGMIGLLMSGYFAGFLIGTWLAPSLIRRIGHIRTFAFYAALAAVAVLVHVLIVNPWVWLVLRVLYGVSLVTLYMVIESWLNAQVSGEKRGQVFALYMAVNLGALAAAQQLLSLDTPMNFTLFALAAILISSALMPITLTRQAQPALPDMPATDLLQLARIAPLPLMAAGISGLTLGGFWGLAPVYASQVGFDAAGVGLLMSITILGGAVLQWPIGLFSDKHDRRVVLLWVVAIAAVLALVITPILSGSLLLGLMFLWGGLAFSIYSIAVAQMVDQLHPDEILSGSSGLLLANGFGAAFGPVVAGGLMHLFGHIALPLFFAVSLGILAIYSFWRPRRVVDLVTEPHGHFTPMLRTSHTVLELMPDTPEVEADAAPANEAEMVDEHPVAQDEPMPPRTGTL